MSIESTSISKTPVETFKIILGFGDLQHSKNYFDNVYLPLLTFTLFWHKRRKRRGSVNEGENFELESKRVCERVKDEWRRARTKRKTNIEIVLTHPIVP